MLGWSVLVPTMVSMLVIGVWHGAGWGFVVFGLMQGGYMVINELWAAWRKDARKARRAAKREAPAWHKPVAQAATLLAFVVAIIPFGSPDLVSIGRLWGAMLGLGPTLVISGEWPFGLAAALLTVVVGYAIVFATPNTQQIMARFEPVLEWARWRKVDAPTRPIEWRMTIGWTIAAAYVFFLGVAFIMRGTTKFIYFNF
jgi:hypothetical protein